MSRRYKTVRKIKWLTQEAKQIIVTTHDLELVFTLFEALSNPSVLKLDYSTCLKEYNNIKIDMELDYFKNIRDIYSFLEEPKESQKVEMIRKIRLVLEDGIKFRFYSELKINNESSDLGPLSSNDGLGNVIDILEEADCDLKGKKEQVIRKLRDLNGFSCSFCHGEIDRPHRVNNVSIYEVISNLKTTLEVLKEKL